MSNEHRVMWDLCCGLKGASEKFRERGWQVITVDINELFKPDVLCDIADLQVRGVPRPDFVWASPPCVEYALRRFNTKRDEEEPSLATVIQCARVIHALRPKFWALENVRLSVPWISKVLGPHRLASGAYFLWGNFPLFVPTPVKHKGAARGPHWLRSALRAKIPAELSADMEAAVSYKLRADELRVAPNWPVAGPADRPARAPATDPAGAAAVGREKWQLPMPFKLPGQEAAA